MTPDLLGTLIATAFAGLVIGVGVAAWPRERRAGEPPDKIQKLRAANRWRW